MMIFIWDLLNAPRILPIEPASKESETLPDMYMLRYIDKQTKLKKSGKIPQHSFWFVLDFFIDKNKNKFF